MRGTSPSIGYCENVEIGSRRRNAAAGAGVAMAAATLFIAATFAASAASLAEAVSLLPAAAGYALLVSWFVVPLGCAVGMQIERIAGDGKPAGVALRSFAAAALITLAGSLLLRIPIDLYRVMTHTAPFRDVTTWWADYRGTLVYFLWVGLYSFPWIASFAWYRSRVMASRRAGSPRAER